MKCILLALWLVVPAALCVVSATAQKVETKYIEFSSINNKKHKPVTSLYNKIEFMDSREDSAAIGMLDSGSRRVVWAALKGPIQPQLNNILQGHLGPNSGDGELCLQLRRLSFSETSGTRYCYTAATVYAHRGDKYDEVYNTDLVLSLGEPGMLYEDLQYLENVLINDLVLRSMVTPPNDTLTYSLDELRHIDSIEKRRLPLYNTATYAEGFYSNYAAFRNQVPDVAGSVITKPDGSIDKLKFDDKKWRDETHAHIYAVVYKGKPYVVTHSGYYPLEKRGDDFYFTGKLRINATAGEKAVGQWAFGMIGRAIVSNLGDKNVYQVLIDHQTGEFIHLKVLETLDAESTSAER